MRSFRSTLEAVFSAIWYLLVVALLPLSILAAFGIAYLWQRGWLLPGLGIWLGITLCAYALGFGLRVWRRRSAAEDLTRGSIAADPFLPDEIATASEWSEREREIWQAATAQIDQALALDPGWRELQPIGLELLNFISGQFHDRGQEAYWRFTLPEALLIIEEASRRYRELVMAYLPYADRLQISTLLHVYRKQDTISSSLTWANRTRRLLRLADPVGAVLGEVRDVVTDRVFVNMSRNLQESLKRLLLQEVAQVGIDLYSGRLKVSDAELASYRSAASRSAAEQFAEPPEPLRIAVLGQVSSGKSSLINALLAEGSGTTAAEADPLPSTDRNTIYPWTLPNGMAAHLLDTPGIEDDQKALAQLADTALDADLLIWIARLDQVARRPDSLLREAIAERLEAAPRRKRPPLLLLVSHIDQLQGGVSRSGAGDEDGRSVSDHPDDIAERRAQAVQSVAAQLQVPADAASLGVCLNEARGCFGIDAVLEEIDRLSAAAVQSQLNRRRVELQSRSAGWRKRASQIGRLAGALGRTLTRRG